MEDFANNTAAHDPYNMESLYKEKYSTGYIFKTTNDMMNKNEMLGQNGLTLTSANFLANVAKELYESLEAKIASLKLCSRDFQLAVNGQSFRIENESDKEDLANLSSILNEIGELKSLIAYLREGIKAKEHFSSDAAFEQHINALIEEGREDLKKPLPKAERTFDDEFALLNAEQKARYYALEARCATIGAAIHPNGVIANARNAYYESKKTPTKVSGKGQEAEISTLSSKFTDEEVDKVFFELQKEHRDIQAELNKMKFDLDTKVAEANSDLANKTYANTKLWMDARKVERIKYDNEVKALKIVIPQNLKGIYEKVNNVATNK